MFQIKDFASITASQIAHMQATQESITDFRVGSVARTLVEAPAIELDEFYQRVLYGLLEAIPIAVYHAFGFDALPALCASGFVRFSAPALVVSDVPIPAGTQIVRPDVQQYYVTTETATILSGQSYVDARVSAVLPGVNGNAPTGTITGLVSAVPGVSGVANLTAIVGGKEAETPDERKARFIEYVGALSRGTVWAAVYGAKSAVVLDAQGNIIEYVSRIGLAEGAGNATIYLWGSGGAPSSNLLAAATNTIEGSFDSVTQKWTPGYRPVGVSIAIAAMVQQIVNVDVRAKMLAGYSLTTSVQNAIHDAIAVSIGSVMPGAVLYVEQLAEAALSVAGIETVLVENNTNLPCGENAVLSLGALTIAGL